MLIGQRSVSDEHSADSATLSSLVDEKYFREYDDTEYREKHNDDEEAQVGALPISKRHVFLFPPTARTHGGLSETKGPLVFQRTLWILLWKK